MVNALYHIRKRLKALRSIGLNPKNGVLEIAAKIVSQRSKKVNGSNKPLNHLEILASTIPEKAFVFSANMLVNDKSRIADALNKYGVCVLTDFISQSDAYSAHNELKHFFAGDNYRAPRDSTVKEYGEEADYIWQTDYAWSDDYLEVVNAKKPVVNIRARNNLSDDAGMVDIFNIEQLSQRLKLTKLQTVLDTMQSPQVSTFLSQHSGYPRRQAHLYHNQGVTQTRGPHIDNNSDPFKLFVYLTDVKKLDDGPYCYLPSSPNERSWMSLERLKNALQGLPSTEVSSFPRDKMIKLFGNAGTAIITNQSGIHCGWPQSDDGERMLLVSNYY